MFGDSIHLGARLGEGDVVTQPAVNLHLAAVRFDWVLRRDGIVRHPQFRRALVLSFARGGQMKFRRKDADYCVDNVVERECLAKGGALAAEMAFMKCVSQNRDMAFAGIGCGRIEAGSERRLHAEERENIRGRARALDALRLRTTR